jgi:hypothetical protein
MGVGLLENCKSVQMVMDYFYGDVNSRSAQNMKGNICMGSSVLKKIK